MTNQRIVFVVAMILSVGLQFGCAVVSKSLTTKQLNKAQTVEFRPWFGESVVVQTQTAPTLTHAVHRPEVEYSRVNSKLTAAVLKNRAYNYEIPDQSHHFQDQCVVLSRGDSHWYFFEPLELMEVFTGPVALQTGDRLQSLPFVHSNFIVESSPSMVAIAKRDHGGTWHSSTVDVRSIIAAEIPNTPSEGWNVTLVSRTMGAAIHHLVLPAAIGSASNLPVEIKTSLSHHKLLEAPPTIVGSKGAFLQDGDVIEMLDRSGFQRRIQRR